MMDEETRNKLHLFINTVSKAAAALADALEDGVLAQYEMVLITQDGSVMTPEPVAARGFGEALGRALPDLGEWPTHNDEAFTEIAFAGVRVGRIVARQGISYIVMFKKGPQV